MTLKDQPLAGVFPQADENQWRRLVERALKGAPFEKLVSKTYDGAAISPLYAGVKTQGPRALRKTPGRWAIAARVDLDDAVAANRLALEDLEGGADGLSLVFAGAQGACGAGLTRDDDETIAQLLANVRLDYGVPLLLEYSPRAPNAAPALLRLIDKAHIDPSITRVAFGFDPLGAAALHGFLPAPWRESAKSFAAQAASVVKAGFAHGAVAADARVIHAAGGSEAQELGFALAAALAYLRALTDAGLDIEAARAALSFRFAADADEFAGAAKFRAIRRLWARVEDACGLKPAPTLVQAETAWRMMSRCDPWNNILRVTIACFSAAIGGADVITALPFTQPLGAPDAFARRLARDAQLVLQDESHIDAVDDPTSGAGGFEALTDELCARGWEFFQKIESAGGLAAALEQGVVQGPVADTAGQRAKNVARAKDKITGANEFPDIAETPLPVIAPFDPAKIDAAAPQGAQKLARLTPRRLSEPFERLREASDAHATTKGARPKVFLANLGRVADFNARANYSKNFFEAGGIEAVFGPETDSLAEIAAAFKASGATLACLCSSDAVYCTAAEEAAKALLAAGGKLYLAGRPGELEGKLRDAGVGGFIFVGCDMHEILSRAFEEAK